MNKSLYGTNLQKALAKGLPEKALIDSAFKKEFWSGQDFACLLLGIAPLTFEKLSSKDVTALSQEEALKLAKVKKMKKKLAQHAKRCPEVEYPFNRGGFLTPWKYIKWIATTGAPCINAGFIKSLPHYLLEIFLEFIPNGIGSKYSRECHRAIYLSHAQMIMASSRKEMSFGDIYDDSHMIYVLGSLKKKDGSRVNYSRKTIVYSWLPKLKTLYKGLPKKI